MTEIERAQAYMTLSQQLYQQYHDRRGLEWRIHIALWTLLLATGYGVISHNIHSGAYSLLLFLAVPLHAVWCIKIHRGNVLEQNLSIGYRKAAERILTGGSETPTMGMDRIGRAEEHSAMPQWLQEAFRGYWWWLGVEIAVTFLIATVVVRLAW